MIEEKKLIGLKNCETFAYGPFDFNDLEVYLRGNIPDFIPVLKKNSHQKNIW